MNGLKGAPSIHRSILHSACKKAHTVAFATCLCWATGGSRTSTGSSAGIAENSYLVCCTGAITDSTRGCSKAERL
mgnify:CR=1 FL=1